MKRLIQAILNRAGLDIIRVGPTTLGRNPMVDMGRFLHNKHPVIFDVGANVGQSIQSFRKAFPKGSIHSFEPSPTTFNTLSQNASNMDDVSLRNFALGSSCGQMKLLENSDSVWSSFLPLGKLGGGEVTRETLVKIRTVDQYCYDENIEQIDILKSDTQGFDLEVFKGARETIQANKIGMIYFELIFSEQYKNLPSYAEFFEFLTANNFHLVTFYRFHYQKCLASWTDALFIHEAYI